MRRVTKENLSVQIDRLRKIKDEQGQLSMSSEYTLQAYEMLLATMEAEPDCNERQLFCSTDTSRMKKVISVSAGTEGTPLYRHAQPAPVVPDEYVAPAMTPTNLAYEAGWNACRAAMLNRK